jgi:hypothetical protein
MPGPAPSGAIQFNRNSNVTARAISQPKAKPRLGKCKKYSAEYEIVGVDDRAIDPEDKFNLHTRTKVC